MRGLKRLGSIDLRCTDKVVDRESADTVRTVGNLATIITYLQVGVVVLLVCDLGDYVDESDGLIVVIKYEGMTDRGIVRVQCPLRCQL